MLKIVKWVPFVSLFYGFFYLIIIIFIAIIAFDLNYISLNYSLLLHFIQLREEVEAAESEVLTLLEREQAERSVLADTSILRQATRTIIQLGSDISILRAKSVVDERELSKLLVSFLLEALPPLSPYFTSTLYRCLPYIAFFSYFS